MALISSARTIEKLIHVVEHSGSAHLQRFLTACFKQIAILSPRCTYNAAKSIFAQLAIAEALYKSPPNNVSEAYHIQTAQLTKRAASVNTTSLSDVPSGSPSAPVTGSSTVIAAAATSSAAGTHHAHSSLDLPRVSSQSARAQLVSLLTTSSTSKTHFQLRRSLDTMRRSLFGEFKRDKGKGKVVKPHSLLKHLERR